METIATAPRHLLDRKVGSAEQKHDFLTTHSISRISVTNKKRRVDEGMPIVFLIDCDSLFDGQQGAELASSSGWQIRKFHSPTAFLESPAVLSPSCLVLDVATPALDLPELQERIAVDRPGMPIILMTGSGDAPATVQATPVGTITHFSKPVCDATLVRAIDNAIKRSQSAFDQWTHTRELRDRYDCLTFREREVMALVVCGRLNKQVGGELGISEITVKVHRGRVMQKMRADSLPDLVTMAARLRMCYLQTHW
jgi:FixJ family two-component response regulator